MIVPVRPLFRIVSIVFDGVVLRGHASVWVTCQMCVCVCACNDLCIYPSRHSRSQTEDAGAKECVHSLVKNLCHGINNITGIVGGQYSLKHKEG